MLLFLILVALIVAALWYFTSERLALGFLFVAALIAILLIANDSSRF